MAQFTFGYIEKVVVINLIPHKPQNRMNNQPHTYTHTLNIKVAIYPVPNMSKFHLKRLITPAYNHKNTEKKVQRIMNLSHIIVMAAAGTKLDNLTRIIFI